MKSTYSLGRLAGVRIGVNWSVLVLLALVIWTLATGVFPETHPELSANVHFTMATVAALGFFTSILLHEMGHAIQARRDGMTIDGITLWLFGGVARFSGGFPSARAELRIAAAGPAISALLSGVFIGLWYLPGVPDWLTGVCGWLTIINLALLGFNLIPALPLDGGRMLRAVIWHRRGDFHAATRVCAKVAQVIAIALMGAGIGLLVVANAFGGIWLAVIAWFVLQAARAELAMADQAKVLPRVGACMDPQPVTVWPDHPLDDIVRHYGWPPPNTSLPVMDEAGPVGLLHLNRLAGLPQQEWTHQLAADRMVPRDQLTTLAPGDDVITALAALATTPEGRVLVLAEGGELVGVLERESMQRSMAVASARMVSPTGR